jgi:hypothetical protein
MAEAREEVQGGARRQLYSRPSLEDYDVLRKDSRLSLPPPVRIVTAAFVAFTVGAGLGVSYGGKMAGLRFRAEHAHRLPTSTTGWYMYHKSKNYHVMFGGLGEGLKTGARLSGLTLAFFCTEHLFDVYRGSRDGLNTVGASLAVSGGFSLIST